MKSSNALIALVAFLCILIIGIPLLILLIVIGIPFFAIKEFFHLRKRKKELKKALKIYDGKIFFLYREYHNHYFFNHFQENYPDIHCMEVLDYDIRNPFIDYITKDHKRKSYPKLIKIEGKNIIRKEHYNSFKHYIRRKNDEASFYELIARSIENLKEFE